MARNAHPEETVQKILDVATDLFIRQGYDETSMQDIINHLGGLSKGAIYHHFASKEDLFDAVVNRIFAQVSPQKAARWQEQTELSAGRGKRATSGEDAPNGLEILQEEHDPTIVGPQLAAIEPIMRSFNPEKNPKLIGLQFLGLMRSARTVMSGVFARGDEDGSMQVKHPQQVAELQMLLANMWMYPLFTSGSSQELRARVEVYLTAMKALGAPVEDRGLADLIASYGSDAGRAEQTAEPQPSEEDQSRKRQRQSRQGKPTKRPKSQRR
ncbi:TetR family transcriptional regulator [Bifidobacterium actinocoloniiforme DSM 22766]|uniref:TetR family transcriptional regulator n=1 Tax=Bifidobacterium actinocoloniiforme DSM 22766 TaxID=1437605 RepID=A0A086Z072_9BIFI|nr:TetR/AcrR family transcriptional regulator [Bifidobacterium actinocoloniiforme]KFI39922.1 TetR family transcriptional regulator [Bifidobacterium actinocoloniiforme DSM 22766]